MVKTILALVDDTVLRHTIDEEAHALGYAVEFVTAVADVIAHLVEKQPWLIVVDLSVQGWHAFVIAAKTSPATRRLPIIAVGSHLDTPTLDQARTAGCDAVVSRDVFMADAAGMIQKHARLDDGEELLRQAQEPLPEPGYKAIEQFNAGDYFEQHETFEHLWRAEPGPVRQMYQGILQVGVAYYQIQRKNFTGARKLFQRAWQYLNALPDVCQGVDIAQLRADAQAAQAELERLGPERIAEFDPAFFKPVVLCD